MEFRTLKAAEIECRAAQVTEKGVTLLLYKDARVDQNILDETVGPMNWQRHHLRDNANCVVSIWDDKKSQWIEKEDTGTESNTEAEKGLASDSFKRACFNWGIGRELYTAPFVWIGKDNAEIREAGTDARGKVRYTTYDKFEVSNIEYDANRNINYLVIRNKKTKAVVFTHGKAKESPKDEPKAEEPVDLKNAAQTIGKEKINAVKISALATKCAAEGVPSDKIMRLYKVASFAELNENQYSNIVQNWEKIKAL